MMQSTAAQPPLIPPRDSIDLSDLLSRLGGRMEATTLLIAQVEAAIGILIDGAERLPADLFRDLQKIDLARQTLCDIGRVLRLAAAQHCPTPVSAPAIATVIQLRDLADHLLRPDPGGNPVAEADRDAVCWF